VVVLSAFLWFACFSAFVLKLCLCVVVTVIVGLLNNYQLSYLHRNLDFFMGLWVEGPRYGVK